MPEIVENGEELDITQERANQLVAIGAIYLCDEDSQYHFAEGYGWDSATQG